MNTALKLIVGHTYTMDEVTGKLLDYNYTKTDDVMRPGEFATRGNIVDIFPFNFRLPIRIEFDFNTVASIRDFTLSRGETAATYTTVTVLPVHEFFSRKQTKEFFTEDDPLKAFLKIKKGDCVVHVNYGIGRYLGIKILKVKGEAKKYFSIEYAGGEILYVEADGRPLIERYIGLEGKKPKLNKLRTKDWERVKTRARLAVKNMARDMIRLQAKRNILRGFQYNKDIDWQNEFEDEFSFQETPDQIRATREVKQDMESPTPMDRLICGDVGYGKTEVAMRAAFKAIMNNKQVALLVPTTILAEQHYLTFKERVRSYPITVEALSRFKTRGEQKEIVAHLKDGSCDIVIGTHRLLSRDVSFKNLGLVIVDEEQRFGVHHKEKLKHYRELVDVLTLTATPIPRTLYMSLVGVRDISMIMTPPQSRLPIRTEVCDYDDEKIKEAIKRERSRGGQIYFVHNRVQSIDKIHTHLTKLMPQVTFRVAHGQMPPTILEKVMQEFFNGDIDCLISTNIIESGLDVPNVNTIIVNRADTFGLSDLYQLRGRVGRFEVKRQAYGYFLIPKKAVITDEARKRLHAIAAYTELGSGFKIAMEDLELRGAGNLLGHEQSGFIYQVGFDLYCRLLHEAVEEEKKRKSNCVRDG
ncbi:MAG: transcription-repair coupling factor [Candidatus Omnitrophota bacterium]